jgi:hypothetical protein
VCVMPRKSTRAKATAGRGAPSSSFPPSCCLLLRACVHLFDAAAVACMLASCTNAATRASPEMGQPAIWGKEGRGGGRLLDCVIQCSGVCVCGVWSQEYPFFCLCDLRRVFSRRRQSGSGRKGGLASFARRQEQRQPGRATTESRGEMMLLLLRARVGGDLSSSSCSFGRKWQTGRRRRPGGPKQQHQRVCLSPPDSIRFNLYPNRSIDSVDRGE